MLPEYIENDLQLFRDEYLDTPDISLSAFQVASLLELDQPTTHELLQASTTEGLLEQTQEAYFVLEDHYKSDPIPNVCASSNEL